MALRILQFCIVFTIGFCLEPSESLRQVGTEINLSIRLSDPRDVTVVKGQNATLRCDARSSAGPIQYTWLHNGVPISFSNESRMILQRDGSLFFPKVIVGKKTDHTGTYQCLVENGAGALLSKEARLSVASLDKVFTAEPTNVNVTEQEPVILNCNIHSTPAAEIQWFFRKQPLPQSTKYVPLLSGALLITKTHNSDSGFYSCKATNVLLKKHRQSHTAELKVLPGTTETRAPSLLPLNTSPNVTILLHESVNLYCAIRGWPIPTIQWLKDNNTVVGTSHVLQISRASFNDAGNYNCIGTNPAGQIVRNYSLLVYEKPYFNSTPVSKEYPSAITVRLSCSALGFPEPQISWLRNGKPLELENRMDILPIGLVFRQSFTSDSGIYQCVAENSVGKISTAAEVRIKVAEKLPPPQNVQCRPYNETSVCLTWEGPKDVSVQAFTVHSKTIRMDDEIPIPETYKLLTGLNMSSTYEFFIRLFASSASDESKSVFCKPAKVPDRNLQIEKVNETAVELKWNVLISDTPCGSRKGHYIVQWRTSDSLNFTTTEDSKITIEGLSPGKYYEYKVYSSYSKSKGTWKTFPKANSGNSTQTISSPDDFSIETVDPTSVNISWTYKPDWVKYYTVCYVAATEDIDCEDGKIITSDTNSVFINKLKPSTLYRFKIRPYGTDGAPGEYSKTIEIKTRTDIPSPVVNLQFKTINETTACIYWQAPLKNSGNLDSYLVSYTPDTDWPLDQWINISIPSNRSKSESCFEEDERTVSFYLKNLNSMNQYTVLVRAASMMGIGKPTVPIIVNTHEVQTPDKQNETRNSQTIGVLIGIVLALVFIICCILLILLRWSCVKRRAIARARLAASNNYFPGVARYATHGSSVQVRLEDPCLADAHEVQQLVREDHSSNIPPLEEHTHLDTKGQEEFPNGQANGCVKPLMNGHVGNGYMCHITENPQYYAFERNGHLKGLNTPKDSSEYEEDSNSNVPTSKFHDLYKLFENSKKSNSKITSTKECSPQFHSVSNNDSNHDLNCSNDNEDNLLNATQMTCLDDSFISNHRRVSPILGPNG